MSTQFLYEKRINSSVIDMFTSGKQSKLGEFYMEIDGYYVFSPEESSRCGYYNEFFLLTLLEKLQELNKDWDLEIKGAFK